MKQLDVSILEADGSATAVSCDLTRVLLAGYTGRDRATVMAHIHELEALGVAPPERIPAIFVVPPELLTTDARVDVAHERTSGEAEFYLLSSGGELLVGSGSDHTDRQHEAINVAESKTMCAKVISPSVWRYRDVRDHWDQLQLRAWVTDANGRRLYQDGPLGAFMTVDALLAELRQAGYADLQSSVVFGGTLPLIGGFAFADRFETELYDPILNRRLSCGYEIRVHTMKGRTA